MQQTIIITKSNKKDKKFMADVNNKTVHFGAAGYSDYTKHKDNERRDRYINRHKKNEDWTKTGIDTAGFYSKHLLWNKPSLKASLDDLNKKYKDVKFVMK